MLPSFMHKLSSAISDNRQLQVINLSLNFFTSHSNVRDYTAVIAEIDQQNTEEEKEHELVITEREKIITSDRDLRAEPVLTPE